MLGETTCVEPLAIHPGVRRHGVHMFVMRYKLENCGGLRLEDFLHVCGAEGAPIYRGYKCTITGQLAIAKLMERRPSYFRLMPTPVAEEATQELIYIPQNVFLGTEVDMSDIAAAIRKVQQHYATRTWATTPSPKAFSGRANGENDRSNELAELHESVERLKYEHCCSRLWLRCGLLREDFGELPRAKTGWSLRQQ